jgi:hypothetical protein
MNTKYQPQIGHYLQVEATGAIFEVTSIAPDRTVQLSKFGSNIQDWFSISHVERQVSTGRMKFVGKIAA